MTRACWPRSRRRSTASGEPSPACSCYCTPASIPAVPNPVPSPWSPRIRYFAYPADHLPRESHSPVCKSRPCRQSVQCTPYPTPPLPPLAAPAFPPAASRTASCPSCSWWRCPPSARPASRPSSRTWCGAAWRPAARCRTRWWAAWWAPRWTCTARSQRSCCPRPRARTTSSPSCTWRTCSRWAFGMWCTSVISRVHMHPQGTRASTGHPSSPTTCTAQPLPLPLCDPSSLPYPTGRVPLHPRQPLHT